jgi:hypothetical protein
VRATSESPTVTTPSPTASSASPTESKPATLGSQAACADKAGDGKGQGDLTRVRLTSDGRSLTAAFATKSPVTSTDTVLYSIDAWNKDGSQGYQLGVKYLNGQQIAYFVFDQVAGKQVNLDGMAKIDGSTVTAKFPIRETEALGDSFKWSATLSVEGDDVDRCPEPGEDVLNPKTSTFPQ